MKAAGKGLLRAVYVTRFGGHCSGAVLQYGGGRGWVASPGGGREEPAACDPVRRNRRGIEEARGGRRTRDREAGSKGGKTKERGAEEARGQGGAAGGPGGEITSDPYGSTVTDVSPEAGRAGEGHSTGAAEGDHGGKQPGEASEGNRRCPKAACSDKGKKVEPDWKVRAVRPGRGAKAAGLPERKVMVAGLSTKSDTGHSQPEMVTAARPGRGAKAAGLPEPDRKVMVAALGPKSETGHSQPEMVTAARPGRGAKAAGLPEPDRKVMVAALGPKSETGHSQPEMVTAARPGRGAKAACLPESDREVTAAGAGRGVKATGLPEPDREVTAAGFGMVAKALGLPEADREGKTSGCAKRAKIVGLHEADREGKATAHSAPGYKRKAAANSASCPWSSQAGYSGHAASTTTEEQRQPQGKENTSTEKSQQERQKTSHKRGPRGTRAACRDGIQETDIPDIFEFPSNFQDGPTVSKRKRTKASSCRQVLKVISKMLQENESLRRRLVMCSQNEPVFDWV